MAGAAHADDMKDMPGMAGMDMSHMDMGHGDMPGMTMMTGALGRYAMMRDASGTAWQPDSTPMLGASFASGGWTGMAHGQVDLVYDHQGGPRGASKTFSESMLMLMAQHALTEGLGGAARAALVVVDAQDIAMQHAGPAA